MTDEYIKYTEPSDQSLLAGLLLGWLFPGLGHVYMRKFWRGLFCCLGITILFFIGLTLCEWKFAARSDFPFYLAGKFGSGFVLVMQSVLTSQEPLDFARRFHYFEIGVLYIATAGLLNFVSLLNLIDIKVGRTLILEPAGEESTNEI